MHSMSLSMSLSWTESLDYLEHVMGPCWCFWAGPHQIIELQYHSEFFYPNVIGMTPLTEESE